HSPGGQRRQVAPGTRLGEALAPDFCRTEDVPQIARPLCCRAVVHEHRSHHVNAHAVDLWWCSQAHALLSKHHLFHQGCAPTTILCGPVQAYPPAVVQPLVPGHARRATGMLRKFVLILPPLRPVCVQIGLQPGPKLLAKRLFLGRIGKIHASPPFSLALLNGEGTQRSTERSQWIVARPRKSTSRGSRLPYFAEHCTPTARTKRAQPIPHPNLGATASAQGPLGPFLHVGR